LTFLKTAFGDPSAMLARRKGAEPQNQEITEQR